MMPHIIPFNEANIETDQPWLTPAEREHAKMIGLTFTREMNPDTERVIMDHLEQRVNEGDQEAINRLHPFCHYILTSDFRIVQEPNFYRWGLFLERAEHRKIDKTQICDGAERERSFDLSFHQRRRRHDAPTYKARKIWISTVFIGTGDEELFETMIFGGWHDGACWRASKLADAKKNHWDAVTMSHHYKNYMKRHGRAARKDWIRMDRFWKLANKRDREWAIKHLDVLERVDNRLLKIPGQPNIPQPNLLFSLAQQFLPRQGILK